MTDPDQNAPAIEEDDERGTAAEIAESLAAAEDAQLADRGGRLTLPDIVTGDVAGDVVPPAAVAAQQNQDAFAAHVAGTSVAELVDEARGDNSLAQRIFDAEHARGNDARSTLLDALEEQLTGE